MKKFSRFLTAVVYLVGLQLLTLTGQLVRVPQAIAQGECSAGFYPRTTSLVTNGNFTVAPSTVYPLGDAGNDETVPGYFYSDAGFYAQVANAGTDIYPVLVGDTINSFSVQNGDFDGSPGVPILNQLAFPGDPTYNIAAAPNWYYSNGNSNNGDGYVVWAQDVSGLTIGQSYVFVAYISSVIEPPANYPSDPTITLKIGGTDPGLPDGTTILGPIVLTELATSNSSPLNGWQRVAFSFTASGTSEVLKIVDTAPSNSGDDFAMTAIGIQECVPVPDYTISLAHSTPPVVGSSFVETVTVENLGPGVAQSPTSVTITLPVGYTVNSGSAGIVTLTNNDDGFACSSNSSSPQILSCESATLIPLSDTQSFDFSISVGPSAAPTSDIEADVSVPLEDVVVNNSATDALAVAPDVTTALTVLTRTATSIVLETKVENIGTDYTYDPITATIVLPAGVTVNSGSAGSVTLGGANAADWACTSDSASPQNITCTHTGIMQNNPSSDQVFTITLGATNSVGQVQFASTITTTGDSNSTNNQSATTSNAPSGSTSLSNTGTRTFTALAFAGSIILIVISLNHFAHKYVFYNASSK